MSKDTNELERLLEEAKRLPLGSDARAEIGETVLACLLRLRSSGGVVHLSMGNEEPLTPGQLEILRQLLSNFAVSDSPRIEALRLHGCLNSHAQWSLLPRATQRALLAWVVARLRHLQDERRWNVDAEFTAATAFSKAEQPGFVRGLSRQHQPTGDSWKQDAVSWHQQLLKMIE